MITPTSTISRRLHVPAARVPVIVLVVALLATTGCNGSGTASKGYDRDGWDSASLEEITLVAEQVRSGPLGCDGFGPEAWDAYKESYQRLRLPMPAAQGACEGSGEDLTFYGFADEDAKRRWVQAKGKSLCERGYAIDWRFALPYVDGDTWIIEPDSVEAAKRLAEHLGRTQLDMCEVAGVERPEPPGGDDTPSTDDTSTATTTDPAAAPT